jgi:hypothetical protein
MHKAAGMTHERVSDALETARPMQPSASAAVAASTSVV